MAGEKVGRPRNSKAWSLRGRAAMMVMRARPTPVPSSPPRTVMVRASRTKGDITCRTLAPRAIFTPISRVRSFTTAYMMLATPMPPTNRVSPPMMPRKIWMPSAMLPVMRWFSRVSQTPSARVSSGSKRCLRPSTR